MSDLQNPERRSWLRRGLLYGLTGTTLAGFGAVLADVWRGAGRFSSSRWIEIAAVDAFPTDGTYPFPGERTTILRRGDHLAALSLECTHLGCLVNTVDQGFYCPCHGSEFGPQGEVYSGPATVSLPWHALRVEMERLWVHSGEKMKNPRWVRV